MQKPTLRWRLKILLAERDIDTAVELHRRLEEVGVPISAVQLGRIIKEPPARLSMEVLRGLITVLQCNISDLIRVEWPEDENPDNKVKDLHPSSTGGGQEIGKTRKRKSDSKKRGNKVAKDAEDDDLLGPDTIPFPPQLRNK